MNASFYERTRRIDELRVAARPTREEAEELKSRLISETLQKYFFDGLENPNWIPPLHVVGLFMKPPRKREVGTGQYQLPPWYAGRYLARHATRFPSIVVEVASTLETDNPQACAELLKALAQIEPSEAKKAAPAIRGWLELPFSDRLLYELKDYMHSLMSAGYFSDLVPLVGTLLEPAVPAPQEGKEKPRLGWVEAKPRFGEFWLEELMRGVLPELSKQVPQELIALLDANLQRAQSVEREASGDNEDVPAPSYWRSAIEDHPENAGLYALKDLLVDGIRDSLVAVCSKATRKAEQYLQKFLSGRDPLRRRIALHTLRSFGHKYPRLLELAVSERSILDDRELHHELYGLLEVQFGNLPSEVQAKIVRWIFEGPEDIEAITQRASQRVPEADVEPEVARYREHWTLRRVWAIREYLEGEAKGRVEELSRRFGEPEHPDLLSWSTGASAITYISPLTVEEMVGLPLEKIVEVIKNYAPQSPSVEHSYEGLAEALAGAVKASPARFVGLAPELSDEAVRFVYTYHYLAAIREAIERGNELDLGPILDLCSYTASLPMDPHEQDRDQYEAGLGAAQFEVANLVQALLKQEKVDLDDEKEGQIRGLIGMLLKNPDPEPGAEMEGGWDPATRSLNCVRGKAMHDLIEYARYQDKKARRQAGEGDHRPWLDPFVKDLLEEKLNKSADGSLAVHSVYGWYTPLIEYFDRNWLVANLALIFPEEPDLESFWRAAWDAYVSFNSVYKRPFLLLSPQYRRAISLLGEQEDPGRLGTTRGQRLGEHLAYAYIHGLIDLESEDRLLSSFYEVANDDLRGHIAFWLARAFGELKPSEENPIWLRMWALLRWRLKVASESATVDAFQEEISSYMRWLEDAPVPFGEMEPFIRTAVPFLKEGYHKKLVADYLARHAEEFPSQTIEIIHRVILLSEAPWFSLYAEDLDAIIGSAARSGNERAVSEAVAVINILGERGDFGWKKYLPQ